jgi:hypothetical protein
MTEGEPEVRVEVIMYDANGNRTDDASAALHEVGYVRGARG